MSESTNTIRRRASRVTRGRSRMKASANRPQLVVFRSNQHIYAQVINIQGEVLASSSDLKLGAKNKMDAATAVGTEVAQKAIAKNIKEVALNRRGYKYHGRVKLLADAARAAGLVF
jgi:large subunit ribosomal protein L18